MAARVGLVRGRACGWATVVGGAMQVAGNSDSLATRQLATSISRDVLVDFELTLAAGAIDRNDFLGLWFGNFNGPNIGMKGNCDMSSGCTSDLFCAHQRLIRGLQHRSELGRHRASGGPARKTGTSNVFNRYSLWVDPTRRRVRHPDGRRRGLHRLLRPGLVQQHRLPAVNLDGGDRLRIDNLKISLIPSRLPWACWVPPSWAPRWLPAATRRLSLGPGPSALS